MLRFIVESVRHVLRGLEDMEQENIEENFVEVCQSVLIVIVIYVENVE